MTKLEIFYKNKDSLLLYIDDESANLISNIGFQSIDNKWIIVDDAKRFYMINPDDFSYLEMVQEDDV